MHKPPLSSRLRPFTSTIFAEMTALAQRTGAVNLGQGFPDTDGPQRMIEVASEALRNGMNQYAPGPGVPELRRAVADHQRDRYGIDLDPDTQVLVTVGATEAVAASLMALVEPDDEVVLLEPYYDSYAAAVAMAGAKRRGVPLAEDPETGRFGLDVAAVRAAIGPRTRALVLNSPHNPCGAVFTREELSALAEVCREHDLMVISDEVYEHLVFTPGGHVPIATLPGMFERTVTISSAGKTFSVTGWKVGWATGPAELVAAVRAAKQFITFVGPGALQFATAHALREERPWVERLCGDLADKQRRLADGLAEVGFGVRRSEGTYFVCADIRPLGFADGLEFCRQLPELAGVAAVPVQVFTDEPERWRHLVRFAFCKRDEVLSEAVDRLAALRK
ncbi:pyridoxal phosphate-dependent aminotransferase [Streptoalloteichus hindustanus]|uniref:Succinyldiaminopimelate aminotransferase apoenzyme n=1 Tax=Streptoalloteichus hindustanus TaxID=2017 RepID=A0A1M4U355_STRHI|nr:pyridoxal phosphate-dependent aminotransferase [Streptoalloteichus hindustanus]SHE51095.1 succinyldiaminopimelate aminotransferase apoenzyme [Streptoalloteichus hindustanus]